MKKTLILIRHAHRNKTSGAGADNGLSAKGRKQARNARKYFLKAHGRARPLVVSSPKERCIETVLPFVAGDRERVRIHLELDEGGPILGKCHAFISWWKEEAPKLVVACTHGDLMPELLRELTGARTELKKGGWAEIEYERGGPSALIYLIQNFDR